MSMVMKRKNGLKITKCTECGNYGGGFCTVRDVKGELIIIFELTDCTLKDIPFECPLPDWC